MALRVEDGQQISPLFSLSSHHLTWYVHHTIMEDASCLSLADMPGISSSSRLLTAIISIFLAMSKAIASSRGIVMVLLLCFAGISRSWVSVCVRKVWFPAGFQKKVYFYYLRPFLFSTCHFHQSSIRHRGGERVRMPCMIHSQRYRQRVGRIRGRV